MTHTIIWRTRRLKAILDSIRSFEHDSKLHVSPPELGPHLGQHFSEEAPNTHGVSVSDQAAATLFRFTGSERGAKAIHVSVAHAEERSDENRIMDLFITGALCLGILDALGQLLTVQALNTGRDAEQSAHSHGKNFHVALANDFIHQLSAEILLGAR